MSNTHEKLLETSADVGENFENMLHRMFALREMIPALVADNYMHDAQTAMHSGIAGLMDGVYDDMKAMSDAYWKLMHSRWHTQVEEGKIKDPFMLPEETETDKATGTNGLTTPHNVARRTTPRHQIKAFQILYDGPSN